MRSPSANSRSVLVLMGLSMVGLLLFLGYWLRQSYQSEKENLQREVDVLLHTTVRSVEDSLIRSIYLDSTKVKDLMIRRESRRGSKFRSEVKMKMVDSTGTRIAFRGPFRRPLSKSEGGEKKLMGAIGLYISLNNSSEEKLDGIQTNNIASLLESSFETKAAMVRLPKDRGIFFNIPDSAVVQSQINSSTYLDIMSDESAIVSVANYQYFLLKKITPQILMALLLALLTAFTFLLLYRNLRKERQLAEIRSGLIANISHELNTPITTASLALEAIKSNVHSPEKQKEYGDIAIGELSRLSLLVDKIMQGVTHPVANKSEWQDVDLMSLTQEILHAQQFSIEDMNAEITVKPGSDSMVVPMDKLQMTGAIQNLIDNAMKYSQPRPKIEISMKNQGDQVIFSVRDNGIGIPRAYQNTVFDDFFRIPSGNIHEIKGHGLGLHYVKKVVNGHGGTIKIESDGKTGTTVLITLNT